jgi:hypothetical protein
MGLYSKQQRHDGCIPFAALPAWRNETPAEGATG